MSLSPEIEYLSCSESIFQLSPSHLLPSPLSPSHLLPSPLSPSSPVIGSVTCCGLPQGWANWFRTRKASVHSSLSTTEVQLNVSTASSPITNCGVCVCVCVCVCEGVDQEIEYNTSVHGVYTQLITPIHTQETSQDNGSVHSTRSFLLSQHNLTTLHSNQGAVEETNITLITNWSSTWGVCCHDNTYYWSLCSRNLV